MGRNSTNLLLLVIGAAIGQGSILVAHSYLLGTGQVDIIGQYGFPFSVVILMQLVVDFGGNVTLARQAVEAQDRLSQAFWSLTAVRIVLALLIGMSLYLLTRHTESSFVKSYLLSAYPGIAASAVAGGGILDGLRRSGLNGLTATLQYAATSVGLIVSVGKSDTTFGVLLGLTSSASVILTLSIQHAMIRYIGVRLGPPKTTRYECWQAARSGLLYMTTWTPTQLIYRAQLLFLTSTFGAAATGTFIFARQFASAVLQALSLIRRVEFPTLVALLQTPSRVRLSRIFKAQRHSIAAAVVGSIGLVVLGAGLLVVGSAETSVAAPTLMLFGAVPLAASLFASAVQVAFASGRLAASTIASITLFVIATAPLAFLPSMTVHSIVLLEVAANAVAALMLTSLMRLLFGNHVPRSGNSSRSP